MSSRRSHGSLFLALSSLPLSAGVAHAATRMPTHVACVGDSITAGTGATSSAKNYPSDLQGLFGARIQVKNFGHSGATMLSKGFGNLPYEDQTEYTAATSFVSGAGSGAVVDVIIMLGTNDSKPVNWTPSGKPKNDQQYLEDYRAMVDHFTALTPKPVVFLALPLATGSSPCCTISGKVIHDEIIPLIKQLATEKNLPVIDLNTPTTGHDNYFVDGVHPNDSTYALVAQVMHDGLLQDLAGAGSGGGGAGGGAGSAAGGNGGSGGGGGASAAGGVAADDGGGGATAGSPISAGSGGVADAASAGAAASAGIAAGAAGAPLGTAGAAPGAGAPGNPGGAGSPTSGPSSEDSSGCSLSARGAEGPGAAVALLGLLWIGVRRRFGRRMC